MCIRAKWFSQVNPDNLAGHTLYHCLIGVDCKFGLTIQVSILFYIAELQAHCAFYLYFNNHNNNIATPGGTPIWRQESLRRPMHE